MKFALIGGLILLVISTVSLAQIRYALLNPFNSLTTILGVVLEIGLIFYIAYHFISQENQPSSSGYSLIGIKGGKATRRS